MAEFEPSRSRDERIRAEVIRVILRGLFIRHPEPLNLARSNHYHPEVYDQDKEELEQLDQQTLWDESLPWD